MSKGLGLAINLRRNVRGTEKKDGKKEYVSNGLGDNVGVKIDISAGDNIDRSGYFLQFYGTSGDQSNY